MIRYHVKQDAITRNFEMAKRLQKIPAWPKFAQSNFNFIIQIVPVVKMSWALSPFIDGCSRILQHAIFESRFLVIYPNYIFLRL